MFVKMRTENQSFTEKGGDAIILKESIRFRADNKKSSPRKIRTALNVILSNCTNSRTFSRDVYGDCFCLQCPKVTFLSDKL